MAGWRCEGRGREGETHSSSPSTLVELTAKGVFLDNKGAGGGGASHSLTPPGCSAGQRRVAAHHRNRLFSLDKDRVEEFKQPQGLKMLLFFFFFLVEQL